MKVTITRTKNRTFNVETGLAATGRVELEVVTSTAAARLAVRR